MTLITPPARPAALSPALPEGFTRLLDGGGSTVTIEPARNPDAAEGGADGRLTVVLDRQPVFEIRWARAGDGVTLASCEPLGGPGSVCADPALAGRIVEYLFLANPDAGRVRFAPEVLSAFGAPEAHGLVHRYEAGEPGTGGTALCLREGFLQSPLVWRMTPPGPVQPLLPIPCQHGGTSPMRPPAPRGLVYERWDPEIRSTISFRAIDPVGDLDMFHDWMNQGRVAFYWELAKPKEELAAYLAALEADPHAYGLIASFDGDPACYYEIYWAKEDRLGKYYEAEDYDRGWHGLVGNPSHLGRRKTIAWFRALTHYLFLDDPRTTKIVGEPRASHTRMLRYGEATGYLKIKEFDFPHKRSTLMHCYRETFFREVIR